jgi:Tol biopolymer transport system component
VLRSPDGDWAVFVEQDEAGKFKSVEVEVLKTIGDYTAIQSSSDCAMHRLLFYSTSLLPLMIMN